LGKWAARRHPLARLPQKGEKPEEKGRKSTAQEKINRKKRVGPVRVVDRKREQEN